MMRQQSDKIRKKIAEAGVALMMVLGSVALLTALVVEFAYNSHITYTMSMNNLDRLKAYYLARSAVGFAKLQVKIEKDIRKQLANYSKYLTGVIGSEPVCKIMPFSTDLLRGGLGLLTGAGEENPEEGGSEEKSEADTGEKQPAEFEGIMAAAAAGDFLSFEGNFSVGCDVEDRKININYFYSLNPQDPVQENVEVNVYEYHKRLVESLLVSSDFDKHFEDSDPTARRELVNNIADWVDQNNVVDESPGFQAGYEEQRYPENSYPVKNGKFSTPGELLLVAGMGDDIYRQLLPNITIYGDDKLNLCLAEEPMIKAFVIRYSNVTQDVDPILPDNNELLDEIVAAVQQACLTPTPKALEVANAIRTVLNLEPEAATNSSKGKKTTKTAESTSKSGFAGNEEGKAKAVPTKLSDQISTENRFYSFDLTGSSGDIILSIKAVLHTEDKDPNKWKMLFYRVE